VTVFKQVLLMFVSIRLLGREPRLPRNQESLIHYAAALEVQHSRISARLGLTRRRRAVATARRIIGLLGLTEAAEPLPRLLLVLRERHESQRSGRLPFHCPTPSACLSGVEALSLTPPPEV
jgi:hypothetical protein